MWPIDNIRNWINRLRAKPINDGVVEQAFDVVPAVSRTMQDNISLWYALYTNEPPWITPDSCVKPLGIARATGLELARYTLSEFNFTISGGARADYINGRMQLASNSFLRNLEFGLCMGGFAFRPYIENGKLYVDASGATAFSPIEFDGNGRCVSGVFKDEITVKHQKYTRLEYHGFEKLDNGRSVYVIRNKAYRGDAGGTPVSLKEIPSWADLDEESVIEFVDRPLFSYFRNPSNNDIEPESEIGTSVYGGKATISLLQQADEQWERLLWEFHSGERKIFTDGAKLEAGQFNDRLFVNGSFGPEGDLFEQFSPEYRNGPLYEGFQYILRRIEDNVGLSRATFSDQEYTSTPQTATAELLSKEKQRKTVKAIQKELESTLDGLIYAVNAFCDLYREELGAPPPGEYETEYNWGDGVLDDPDTLRQDMAMDMSRVAAGLMTDVRFVMKWDKVSEEEAKAMLPKMEDMVTEEQDEVE